MKLSHTRAMIRAASPALDAVPAQTDPVFDLRILLECPGVPKGTGAGEYLEEQGRLSRQSHGPGQRFHKNFELFAPDTPEAVRNAGPKVAVSR
jgi:ATP-dependent phosphoenolpyruvate carboxykinase